MTLIEMMIVVIIMAMVSTAVGVAAFNKYKEAKVKETKRAVHLIASVVDLYRMENAECPTVVDLLESGNLNSHSKSIDAWDHPYVIECENDDVAVRSAGPDGEHGNADDIAVE